MLMERGENEFLKISENQKKQFDKILKISIKFDKLT